VTVLETLARAIFGVDPARAIPVFLLVLARTVPLAQVAPWLGWKGTALFARLVVSLALAIALTPIALASAPQVPGDWLSLSLLGVREALVGAIFAVATSVPLWALGFAGELIDRWRGSPAESIGPGGTSGPLGTLHIAAGVIVFVLVGGHRLAIAAFADTLVELPPGAGASGADLAAFALGAARLVTASLELALAFLAPAALAFVVLELVIGLAERVAPDLRSYFAGMPLRAALGVAVALFGLAALLPRLAPLFADSVEAAADLVRRFGG
jgi:type III secretory pathway component EscT